MTKICKDATIRNLSIEDIDKLLWNKLPEYMNEQKKKMKINNLINELSNKLKKICNKGSKGSPKWEFYND